jgi:hypothetical protein
MTKSVKETPVTPANTSKRAVARLKVREAKHGTIEPRSRQKWIVGLIGKGWLK